MRALALVLVGLAGAASARPVRAPAPPERELERMTRELLAAVAPGDWSVWDRYLDENAIYSAEDGKVMTKAQLEQELKPLPPGYSGTIVPGNFVFRIHGDTAVVNHEDIEDEVVHGQKLHVRYRATDTWIRKGGQWKLVATQVLALQDDPVPVKVDPRALAALAGSYRLAPGVLLTVTVEGDHLVGERAGRPKQQLLPETDTVFFTPGGRGRKLFVRDAAGRVTHIVDRRDGHDLRWTRVPPPAGAPARARP